MLAGQMRYLYRESADGGNASVEGETLGNVLSPWLSIRRHARPVNTAGLAAERWDLVLRATGGRSGRAAAANLNLSCRPTPDRGRGCGEACRKEKGLPTLPQ